MSTISKIQYYFLLALCVITPLALSTTTAEFFTTTKMYLLTLTMMVVALLFAVELIRTKKIHRMHAPFATILTVLVIARALSTAFATSNWMQALYLIPAGGLIFLGMYIFYILGTYVLSLRSSHSNSSLFSYVTIGTFISSIVIIVFYFQPLSSAQLPQHLLFLKSQFSPIGNSLDSLILLGASALGFIYAIHSSTKLKQHALASRNLIALVCIGVACSMIAITLYKASGSSFKLTPFSLSWYAALETLKSPTSAVIGTGIDSFESVFTKVKPLSYNVTDTWNTNYGLSRSALLHVWVESGLLGLISLLMLAVYAIREVHGLVSTHAHRAGFYVLLGLYLLAIWLVLPITFMTLFVTVVYLIELSLASKQSKNTHDGERPWIALSSYPIVYVGLSIAILAGISGLLFLVQKTYRAEIAFKKSIDAIQVNDGKGVYDNLQRAVSLYPQIERFRAQFAQVNLLLANTIARKAQEKAKTGGAEAGDDQKSELSNQDRQAIAQFIQQAISEAKALVALNPQKASSWNTLAVIYRNVINVADGAQAWTIASYQEALRRDPNNPQLLINLGGVYYGAEDYESASQAFQQAVISKPNWANAHYNLAWSLFKEGNYQQAVSVMNNVLQLVDPKSKDGKIAKENLEVFKKKAESSKPESKPAVEVTPVPENQSADIQPLQLPATPEAKLSPALQLPESSAPPQ